MNVFRSLATWALLICCIPPALQAQAGPARQGPTSIVTGTVIDPADQPIDGVLVYIDGAVRPVLTGAVGSFRLEFVAHGTHALNFRKSGFAPRTFRLPLTPGDGDRKDIGVVRLEPGPEPTSTIAGTVTEGISGRPVAGALVSLNGNTVAVTNADGTFRVQRAPVGWGPNQFHVRHLSFADVTDDIWVASPDEAFALDVTLIPVPVAEVPEIVVEVDRTMMVYGRMRPFYERRNLGLGDFFTRRDIEARNPTNVSDVLSGLPGVRLRQVGLTGMSITLTRAIRGFNAPCESPAIFIDGARVEGGLYLNQLLTPDQMEAMEVYQGTLETPQEFTIPNENCGAIVIWTR